MSGFIGGSSATTDRNNQLAGINASWNVYNTGLPLGQNLSTAGQGTTGNAIGGLEGAQKYWQNLMSGSPQAIQKAAAPAINSANQQADAQRRAQAQTGTSRGGGVASANQQAETNRAAQVNNLVGGLQAEAPQQLASTSAALDTAGEAQMKDALTALGLDEATASEIIDSSIKSRPISEEANPLNGVTGALTTTAGSALNGVLDGALTALGF